ncbi:MAG: hypothetical protein C0596_03155 [Marinilabiliales bacterium]|nr:MAG: hypothetical protein C0596_03155 [Marinilabiliales bacterium]
MNKKIFLAAFLATCVSSFLVAQNVCISETPITPDASSILEVQSSDKGVLLPRIALTGATDNTTVSSPLNTLLIYNTSTAGSSPNEVSPGYYYWSTSDSKWLRLCSDKDAWLLSGNTGTNSTTDFIGTTDSQDLMFKTNNTERMHIESSGNVGIGSGDAWGKLTVNNGRLVVQNEAGYSGSGTSLYKDNPWVYLWCQETSLAEWQGGNIIFAAMQNATDPADICMIEGVRENGTSNNNASKLSFYTRPSSSTMVQRMIIDSNGDITFKPDNDANKNIIINDLGVGTSSEPTIVPSTHLYGFLGTSTQAWWRGYANSFVSLSSKKWKTNITSLTTVERNNLYNEFLNLDVVTYNPVREITDTAGNKTGDELMPQTFGLIAEDSPEIIVDETGDGIKLYEYISLLTVALQESNKRIDELEKKLAEYEKELGIKPE